MNQKLAQTGQTRSCDAGWAYANLVDAAQVPDALTLDILRGVARGKSNRELALDLHVSVRTLCRTLAAVRELWHVDTTIEAVVIAARLHLI